MCKLYIETASIFLFFQIVCSELGYDRALNKTNVFGPGMGPIWLDNVICSGLEDRLGDCDHNGWGVNNCNHKKDIGVVCKGKHYQLAVI